MNKNKNPFLRPRAASPQPEEVQPKPTSEMSDAEIEEGIRNARKDLLEAQRDALRERERARVAPEDGAPSGRPSLGKIFKNSNRRRFS
jgi:hypothetical protein